MSSAYVSQPPRPPSGPEGPPGPMTNGPPPSARSPGPHGPPPHPQMGGPPGPPGPPGPTPNGYPQRGPPPPGAMPAQNGANPGGPPNPHTVQRLLDENAALIKTISEYQSVGKHSETVQYQWSLHRNLMYLASIADSSQNLQNLLLVIQFKTIF